MPDNTPVYPPQNPSPLLQHITSIYKHWNAAYRGMVPHGVRAPAPDVLGQDEEYDEPTTFADDDVYLSRPDADEKPFDYKKILPIPVVIIDDIHSTNRGTETYFTAYQEKVGDDYTQLIINKHISRVSVRISNNGPGIVYLGQNESVGRSGYALAVNEALTMTTTREVWAIQVTGQAAPSEISILYEYDNERE